MLVNLPSVALIVLAWNRCDLTVQCLQSLASLDYAKDRLLVIVVDNDSRDDTVATVRARFPWVLLIESEQNLGYAGGNNIGLQAALARGVDYIGLVNNDVIVAPGWLRALVDVAQAHDDIGMIGGLMYYANPADRIFAAGSKIDWHRGDVVQRGMGSHDGMDADASLHEPADVDFIVGCGVLAKRHVVERVGLLDLRYYLNYEDVDWCTRARRLGWRVHYVPQAVLWHQVSATLGQASPQNTYYMTRNALLFFGTYLQGWPRVRALFHIISRNLAHIAAWSLKPEYRQSAQAKRRANLLALRDAALQRWGPMGPDVEAICQAL